MIRICFVVLSLWLTISFGELLHGDIVVSVQPDMVFNAGNGLRSIDILTNSNTGTDTVIALVVDFTLEEVDLAQIPGGFAAAPNGDSGAFMFSNGALSSASTLAGDAAQVATLSMDFAGLTSFPTTAGRLSRLDFDISGIAPGTYAIELHVTAQDLNGEIATQAVNGSFVIQSEE